jgi:hypothetical protein
MAKSKPTKKKPADDSIYSVHPAVDMLVKWIATLQEKTGRDLQQWMAFIKKEGPETEQERHDWLKSTFKLGTNTAIWLAERSVGKITWEDSPEGYLSVAPKYVETMFTGKESLRPIYDELLKLGRSLGPDVKFCPCTTIVPFYRNHVFAQVKPTTKTRIDFGLALGDTAAKGALIDTGGFKKKDRITHRFAISSVDDINQEVEYWLKLAYERDA